MQWIALTTEEKFASLLEQSKINPVLIFKHSTRCSVSAMAKRSFEQAWPTSANAEVYLLDLIAYRSVSNLWFDKTQYTDSEKYCDEKMQQHESEKKKIIIFVAFDNVVQHQTEKQENTADECLNGSPEDFAQTWFFQYAGIGVGEKIDDLLIFDKHEFVDSLFKL